MNVFNMHEFRKSNRVRSRSHCAILFAFSALGGPGLTINSTNAKFRLLSSWRLQGWDCTETGFNLLPRWVCFSKYVIRLKILTVKHWVEALIIECLISYSISILNAEWINKGSISIFRMIMMSPAEKKSSMLIQRENLPSLFSTLILVIKWDLWLISWKNLEPVLKLDLVIKFQHL